MQSGIYRIINPNGKTYIGKTSNIIRRKNRYKNLHNASQPKIHNSIKKYGWENHKFEIIEFCPETELTEKEIFYKTNFINEKGWDMALFLYIRDEGGEPLKEETKQKISKAKKGHICFNDEWKRKISISLRKGNHSQYYTSDVKNKISNSLKNKPKPFTEKHISSIKESRRKSSKKVYQFDLQGNLIKEWKSKGEASEHIIHEKKLTSNVVSQIKDCILGHQKTAFGYIWSYENIKPKNIFDPIHQFDINRKLTNTFNSLRDLKEWLKNNRKEIADVNTMASQIKKKSKLRIYKSGNNLYSVSKEI